MLSWFCSFFDATELSSWTDVGFIIAFADLIVSTFFDIAFHGLLRVRLSAGARTSSSLDKFGHDLYGRDR